MMKTFKIIILIILLGFVTTISDGCGDGNAARAKSADNHAVRAGRNKAQPKIVALDELVAHPADFKGVIGVRGTVKQIGKSKDAFVLGCEDSCISLPATFKGKMPPLGTEVVVYGQVTRAKIGKYIFTSQEIKPR